ncbi:hypothetical protein GUJ93_ZPchr0001g31317 [Zizania palustris]|uniref:Uncharacterized protein n=1 Tax=Zizania palustris TaxID=103762 RepID=A0A8J5VTY9_ZIZPA|nr:hypothetical protein GUJ93_ZPchr0001g31317 [Zizania palustris]
MGAAAGTAELTAPPHHAVNVSGGGCLPSSWPPPAGSQRRVSAAVVRSLQLVVRDVSPAAGWCGHRAWRRLLRRLAQETRWCICNCSSPAAASRPRPITFGYDAASYAKNFDDGRRPVHYHVAPAPPLPPPPSSPMRQTSRPAALSPPSLLSP